MSKEISIRRATAADLEVVVPLFEGYRQFYGQPADLALARRFLAERFAQGDSVIFLAVRATDGCGLGFTQLYPSFSSVAARRIWILNDLYVIPDARRDGVGRRLMEAARQHGVATGARRLVLATAHSNVSAQRLYEAVGYIQDTNFRQYELEL
jgi:ribosomal protein S18 acetylase RimI-like enzyme